MLRQFLVASIIAAALALPAVAQTGAVVSKGPGVAGAAQTVHLTATITAIDPATRSITLKGSEGKEVTVNAGPQVKNFAQMKVGDQVNAAYTEALTIELKKGGGMAVARTEQAGAAGAKPGDSPAGPGRTTSDRCRRCDRRQPCHADHYPSWAAAHSGAEGPRSRAIQARREGRSSRSYLHRGGRDRGHTCREEVELRSRQPRILKQLSRLSDRNSKENM